MAHRLLRASDAFWRESNQMRVLNTDLGKQLESGGLGARLWRLRPGEASTKHRHQRQEELYVLLEVEAGFGSTRKRSTWGRSTRFSSSQTPRVRSSTTPMSRRFGSWSALRRRGQTPSR